MPFCALALAGKITSAAADISRLRQERLLLPAF